MEVKEKMNEAEALEIQLKCAVVFRMMSNLPLDKAIENLNKALALGPYLDPTLYMAKAGDAQRLLRILTAIKKCRDTIKKEFPQIQKQKSSGEKGPNETQ